MTKLIAVIHHDTNEMSLANAKLACELGYEGVCFIHMDGEDHLVEPVAVSTKRTFPDLLVITNRLRMHPVDMIRRDGELCLNGCWSDSPGVHSEGVSSRAAEINAALASVRKDDPDFLFFGSVAFKYQRHEPDPAKAAVSSRDLGWITTTSGSATGSAPPAAKLALMKSAIGDAPLAVASGITPDNAAELTPHVDWVLVSTGISKSFHEFDRDLMKAMRLAAPN